MLHRLRDALRGASARRRRCHRYRLALRSAKQFDRSLSRSESAKEKLQSQLSEIQQQLALAHGEIEVLESQILMFAAWENRERSRLEAEAAMNSARKVRALSADINSDNGGEL